MHADADCRQKIENRTVPSHTLFTCRDKAPLFEAQVRGTPDTRILLSVLSLSHRTLRLPVH